MFTPGDKIKIDAGTAERGDPDRRVGRRPRTRRVPDPNVIFTEPLAFAHAAGAVRARAGLLQSGRRLPAATTTTEGKFEALEFAAGNYGLLESAYEYAQDDKPPEVIMTGRALVEHADHDDVPVRERAVGDPLHDRRVEADTTSTLWDSTGPREPGESFVVTTTTEFRWLATDIKGNRRPGRTKFTIK